jgi:isochorismate pyruvate lyase
MSEREGRESLENLRANIDRVDREIVRLLAERWQYAQRAPRIRRNLSMQDANVSGRIEQVVASVRRLAGEAGVPPDLVERVYRALIASYIEQQQQAQQERQETQPAP